MVLNPAPETLVGSKTNQIVNFARVCADKSVLRRKVEERVPKRRWTDALPKATIYSLQNPTGSRRCRNINDFITILFQGIAITEKHTELEAHGYFQDWKIGLKLNEAKTQVVVVDRQY